MQNDAHYIQPSNNPIINSPIGTGSDPYFHQHLESDAESFARRVLDLLPARW